MDTNTAEDPLFLGLLSKVGTATRARLDIGDVHIEGTEHNLTIERKSWPDFVSSMSDGRLNEQKLRFLETRGKSDILMYIVEGELQHVAGRSSSGISNVNLNAWMLKTNIRDGVCVYRTKCMQDTIEIIFYLQSQLLKGTLFEHSTGKSSHAVALSGTIKRKRKNVEENLLVYMLASIPGMSIAKARAVSEKYPNLRSLSFLTEGELSNLLVGKRRLGNTLAKRLCSLC